jgi:hypothetical protein
MPPARLGELSPPMFFDERGRDREDEIGDVVVFHDVGL